MSICTLGLDLWVHDILVECILVVGILVVEKGIDWFGHSNGKFHFYVRIVYTCKKKLNRIVRIQQLGTEQQQQQQQQQNA
jgi:hypothetical protein